MTTRLSRYGGRIIETDGIGTVELRDPNDNAGRRYQYRRAAAGIERRVLRDNGQPFFDTGSPWESMTVPELSRMLAIRGDYHPILDPLGL